MGATVRADKGRHKRKDGGVSQNYYLEAGIEAAEAGGFDSAGLGEASKYSKTTYKVNNFKEILDIV